MAAENPGNGRGLASFSAQEDAEVIDATQATAQIVARRDGSFRCDGPATQCLQAGKRGQDRQFIVALGGKEPSPQVPSVPIGVVDAYLLHQQGGTPSFRRAQESSLRGQAEIARKIWPTREVPLATERQMPKVSYKIARDGEMWCYDRNGEKSMAYVTQEAAFEAATADAGGDLRSGFDISIEAASPTDPAGASRESGGRPMRGDGFS